MLKLTVGNQEVSLYTDKCKHLHSQPLQDDSDMLMRTMELKSLKGKLTKVEWTVPVYSEDDLETVAAKVFDKPYMIASSSADWIERHLLRPLVLLKNLQELGYMERDCSFMLWMPYSFVSRTVSFLAGAIVSISNIASYLNYVPIVRIRYYEPAIDTGTSIPDTDTSTGSSGNSKTEGVENPPATNGETFGA